MFSRCIFFSFKSLGAWPIIFYFSKELPARMLVLFKCSGKTGQTTPSHWKSKYENAILQTCSSRFIFWGCGLMTFLFRGGGHSHLWFLCMSSRISKLVMFLSSIPSLHKLQNSTLPHVVRQSFHVLDCCWRTQTTLRSPSLKESLSRQHVERQFSSKRVPWYGGFGSISGNITKFGEKNCFLGNWH